ncbi:uncharacterized protein LOC134535424 isoform X2 [Bacillus rossius redtenbacheri]|uniref:uncharacterized protein LOC134535424 isoform X2 n=1 Tax=Bacillus rossius redtenbacheri TaxID=93214 RepID=UPI002FDD45D1
MGKRKGRDSFGKRSGDSMLDPNAVNATSVRPENMYPVYYPPVEREEQLRQNKDNESDGSYSRLSLTEARGAGTSYHRALYSQPSTYAVHAYPAYSRPGVQKMDMPDSEPATKKITSYEADRSPVYSKQRYSQAEPPPYPPLADSESSEISSVKISDQLGYSGPSDAQPDMSMSYLPEPQDYSYYGVPSSDSSHMSLSYQHAKPEEGPSKEPTPTMKDASVGKRPVKLSSLHTGEYLMHKPPDAKMPGKDYDYLPYNPDEEEQYLPYNPETSGHSPHETTEAEEIPPSYGHHHYHSAKTKPKDSDASDDHKDDSEEEFVYPYPSFHGKEPKPGGEKIKPDLNMYSSFEDDSSDAKPPKPKSKPPPAPPDMFYSGPHKPLHNYDSYLEDEHKSHKHEEEEDNEYHHEPEDHNSDYRLNKKPYSYYYLGRKLWYIPLYFSVYFIVYVTALILKSIARHKIKYPITHWSSRSLSGSDHLENISANVTQAISSNGKLFMR